MERNNLMSKCYPKIKEYCREKHGLEFQVSLPEKIFCDSENFPPSIKQKHP